MIILPASLRNWILSETRAAFCLILGPVVVLGQEGAPEGSGFPKGLFPLLAILQVRRLPPADFLPCHFKERFLPVIVSPRTGINPSGEMSHSCSHGIR